MLFSAPGFSLNETSASLTVALSGSRSAWKLNPEKEKDRGRACVDADMGPPVSSRFRRDSVEPLDDERECRVVRENMRGDCFPEVDMGEVGLQERADNDIRHAT